MLCATHDQLHLGETPLDARVISRTFRPLGSWLLIGTRRTSKPTTGMKQVPDLYSVFEPGVQLEWHADFLLTQRIKGAFAGWASRPVAREFACGPKWMLFEPDRCPERPPVKPLSQQPFAIVG